jgi:LysM repeat protein
MTMKAWPPLLLVGAAAVIGLSQHHPAPVPTAPTPVYVAPTPTPAAPPAPTLSTYVVAPGDTLYNIAAAHRVTLAALLQSNAIVSTAIIQPGQVLVIPLDGSDAPVTRVPAPAARALATAAPAVGVEDVSASTVVAAAAAAHTAPAPAAVGAAPTTWAATCPNGDCFGATSPTTGLPRTQYVAPYVRKDGTVVGGYYRSHR